MFKLFKKKAVKNISPAELAEMIGDNQSLVMIDVRTPQEYAHDGHIPGSRLMPLASVSNRINELPQDRPLIMVCRSGSRSSMACEMLDKAGYSNAINLRGGMIAWKRAGLAAR